MQLSLFGDERSYKSTTDTPTCVCNRCEQEMPHTIDYFPLKRTTIDKHDNKTYWLGRTCKDCVEIARKVITTLHSENKPNEDGLCDCCGKKAYKLKLDHDHDTQKFRGWLCDNCNTGIGRLGDSIEGLEQAIVYLRKHYDGQP